MKVNFVSSFNALGAFVRCLLDIFNNNLHNFPDPGSLTDVNLCYNILLPTFNDIPKSG